MNAEREKNAELIRMVAREADLDGLDRFMAQYSRAAVAEWLVASMPVDARRLFLQSLMATYAAELVEGSKS